MLSHSDEDILVAKKKLEVRSMPITNAIEAVAALAWNATKDKTDPEFDGCILTHQQKLVDAARGVEGTGLVESAFDKEVAKLLADPDGTYAAINKGKIAASQAVVDAVAANHKKLEEDLAAEQKAFAAEAKEEAAEAKAEAAADAKEAAEAKKAAKAKVH
jgi:hypothetical protein